MPFRSIGNLRGIHRGWSISLEWLLEFRWFRLSLEYERIRSDWSGRSRVRRRDNQEGRFVEKGAWHNTRSLDLTILSLCYSCRRRQRSEIIRDQRRRALTEFTVWHDVTIELGKIVLEATTTLNLFSQKILFVQKQNDGNSLQPARKNRLVRPPRLFWWDYRLFQIFSNNSRDSFNRFFCSSSMRTRLKLLQAMTNMIAVTSLKHWIHFRRSSCCPPTSNMLGESTVRARKHLQSKPTLTESERVPQWRLFRRCLMSEHGSEEYPRRDEIAIKISIALLETHYQVFLSAIDTIIICHQSQTWPKSRMNHLSVM